MRTRTAFAASTLAIGSVLTMACSTAVAPESTAVTEDDLYADGNSFARNGEIDVCWNFDGWDHEKEVVRRAVQASWMTATDARVTNWTRCGDVIGPGDHDYLIDLYDGRPKTTNLGGGWGQRMYLNFAFNAWPYPAAGFTRGLGTDGQCNEDQAHRDHCIASIAVHEFGHALGFAHEQNRADRPSLPGCNLDPDGTGNLALTPFDAESVMNYCNPRLGNWGVLSPWDILGAQKQYGDKGPGALVGRVGEILDVSWYGTANGSSVGMALTHKTPNQIFPYDQASGNFIGYGGNCLEVHGLEQNDGANVWMWQCWQGPNQQWKFQNTEIQYLGKCLDRHGGTNGTRVTIEFCNGTPGQKWEVNTNGEIRPAFSDQSMFGRTCLEVAGTNKSDGGSVGMWDCWGGENQKWRFGKDGQIQVYVGSETKCLDVKDMNKADGTPLQAWSCWGGESQKFALHGAITSFGETDPFRQRKCLESSPVNGAMQINACNDTREQTWSYIPTITGNGVWYYPGTPVRTEDVFSAGYEWADSGYRDLYLCVGKYNGGEHPGKMFGGTCFIGYAGKEIPLGPSEYRVLSGVRNGSASWIPSNLSLLSPSYYAAGHEAWGTPLYSCRADYNGGKVPGKVVGGTCLFPQGGIEIPATSYEVLAIAP